MDVLPSGTLVQASILRSIQRWTPAMLGAPLLSWRLGGFAESETVYLGRCGIWRHDCGTQLSMRAAGIATAEARAENDRVLHANSSEQRGRRAAVRAENHRRTQSAPPRIAVDMCTICLSEPCAPPSMQCGHSPFCGPRCAMAALDSVAVNGCPICRTHDVAFVSSRRPTTQPKAKAKPKARAPTTHQRGDLPTTPAPAPVSDVMITAWREHETRPAHAIPEEYDYGNVQVKLLKSPVDLAGIYQIFRYMEMRCLTDKLGRPYARICSDIIKRTQGWSIMGNVITNYGVGIPRYLDVLLGWSRFSICIFRLPPLWGSF